VRDDLISKLSDEKKLEIYALFKQGTTGDCNTFRPGMMDFKGKAKWDAWHAKKGIGKDQARVAYIKLLKDYGVSIENTTDCDFSAEDLAETISPVRKVMPKS